MQNRERQNLKSKFLKSPEGVVSWYPEHEGLSFEASSTVTKRKNWFPRKLGWRVLWWEDEEVCM